MEMMGHTRTQDLPVQLRLPQWVFQLQTRLWLARLVNQVEVSTLHMPVFFILDTSKVEA